MAGSVSRFALLVSKFRGCLVGSLVGDCLGSSPEVEQIFRVTAVGARKNNGANLDDNDKTLPYSAHTRMLRCVGESLLHCSEFDKDDLAARLVHENTVNKRFPDLRNMTNFGQVGLTSTSNVASAHYQADIVALRTTPFALFYFTDAGKAIEVAKESVNMYQHQVDKGMHAIMHCLATHFALHYDPIRPLNVELFLDRLMSAMAEVEASVERTFRQTPVIVNQQKLSLKKLESIREMLRLHYDVQKAVPKLAEKSAEASSSVPAAIFTFLQNEQRRNEDKSNPLEQVLQKALSVPQTSEVLASLSCGLTGAFHGIEAVPVSMRKQCQGLHETVKLADRLSLQFESRPPGLVEMKEISFVQRV